MPRIPDAELERIKATVDLAAIVRSRGVELKKHGSRDLIGSCPFHEDKSASFVVTPSKRLFHCMGCGLAGNVIQFVERFDGLSFRHAFELLASGSGFAAPAERVKHSTVRKMPAPIDFAADDVVLLRQVADYYHERLMNAATGSAARAYLKQRGLDDEGLLRKLRIGFADRSLGLTLPTKQRKDGQDIRQRLEALGIYRESGHEHLNGCLIVPIFDDKGNVTELYGRRLDDGGKSGIKHLYLPGPHVGIFNPEALNHAEVILCEALLDALTFMAAGFANVTSIYGTEGFTDELFEALKRRKVQRVKLAYDADDAGERAAARDAERLRSIGIEVYRVKFPWGMDANEYARKVTPSAQSLRLLVNGASWLGGSAASPVAPSKTELPSHIAPAPSSLAASLVAKEKAAESPPAPTLSSSPSALSESGDYHTLTIDERLYRVAGLAKNSGPETLRVTLRVRVGERMHQDALDLCKDRDRRFFAERAAEECGLTTDALRRDLGRLLLACEQWQEQRSAALAEPAKDAAPVLSVAEEAEALALLRSPDLTAKIVEMFNVCGLVGEDTNKLVALLACVSRKLARPLAVIVQSTSAAGKSTLMEAVLSMIPAEDRIKYSAMTGQSLYYLGEANIQHKILAIVEEEGAEKASYALKLLQSEGELTIASTGKDPNTGRMVTQEYHVQGPVMIFLTTTAIDIDEELMNRCLVLSVDESREQTERIHVLQREARTVAGIVKAEQREDLRRVMQNAQRMLKPWRIANDFAPLLTFSSERTRTRRDHDKYLTLIDSIALLHQHQRQPIVREVNGRMIEMLPVTLEDIATANRLAPEILSRSLDELPPQTRRLLAHIRELVAAMMERSKAPQNRCLFSRRELREKCGWSTTQVRLHLERLVDHEYLATRAGRMGTPFCYELIVEKSDGADGWHIGLIDTDKLAHTYDRNLTGFGGRVAGKRPPLAALDQTGQSGCIPDAA